jgi:hypothetical protein
LSLGTWSTTCPCSFGRIPRANQLGLDAGRGRGHWNLYPFADLHATGKGKFTLRLEPRG